MMMPSMPQLAILLLIFVVFVLPLVLVVRSRRVAGTRKFFWFAAVFMFSWLGYLAFVLLNKGQRMNTA